MLPPAVVADLVRPTTTVTAATTCEELDVLFRRTPRLSCVAVVEGERVGLLMRDAFDSLMSGPYGFGRTLLSRRPVGEIADWMPLRVDAGESVVAVAERLRTRAVDRRYDDLLVTLDKDELGFVSAADLFDGLARQFTYRAIHDDLTGVVNRAHFLELFSAMCADVGTQRVILAVVDVDHMKRINDTRGHLVGDAVLTRTATQLSQSARPGELVARLGADEFVVLSKQSRAGSAMVAGGELGARCWRAITAPGTSLHAEGVRVSVGVAVSGIACDATTLLAEADMAVHRAKQAGGNKVEVSVEVGGELTVDAELVDRSVIEAIRADELELWYQPIVRIRDLAIFGIEALVRWRHPTMGVLGPNRFLPGAARSGHLPDLDRWVVKRACADLIELTSRVGRSAPGWVAVNIAPATLATEFDELVESALTSLGLPARRLVLELPEEADLATIESAARRLEKVRRLGVDLLLDDMGAGSTSLRHLSSLAVGGLKIDASFIAGMLHNPRDHMVVKLLADLGRGLHLPVIAEGVEDATQLAALGEMDIEYAQGYYLWRPQPLETLTALLRTGTAPATDPTTTESTASGSPQSHAPQSGSAQPVDRSVSAC